MCSVLYVTFVAEIQFRCCNFRVFPNHLFDFFLHLYIIQVSFSSPLQIKIITGTRFESTLISLGDFQRCMGDRGCSRLTIIIQLADVATRWERRLRTGGRAEWSRFCCILTIFGYLYCVLRRQMTFPFSC